MIKIDKAIIVEGKYDKIKLDSLIDATIITTDGFGVFQNNEKLSLIKKIAEKKGVVILTDSDSAGNMIRTFLCKHISPDKIFHAYIPEILGKEKRKSKPSSEGTLGVEGVKSKILIDALEKSGVFSEIKKEMDKKITALEMFELGLNGAENSREIRKKLLKFLQLPSGLSTKGMLTAINALYSYDEFKEKFKEFENA